MVKKDVKYAASWSGGKDSALALYRAQRDGFDVSSLFTMVAPDGYTMSHRIPSAVLGRQARALGLPVLYGSADWNGYEAEFKRVLRRLKADGCGGCIFGDIDVEDHLQWCIRVCSEESMEAVHPLWGCDQEELVLESIDAGFDAVIVVVRLEKLGPEWLGRRLTREVLEELKKQGITACGELGEYHTLVVGGPIFKGRLEVKRGGVLTHNGYGFLDLCW